MPVDLTLTAVSVSEVEGSGGIYNPLEEFNEGIGIPSHAELPKHQSHLTFYWEVAVEQVELFAGLFPDACCTFVMEYDTAVGYCCSRMS